MAQTNFKDREEIPAEYKWDLNAIYSNWEEWENGLKEMEAKMETITSFKGKLKEDVKNLIAVKKLDDEIGILSYKVYRYPQLTLDTDTRNQDAASKLQQVQIVFAKFGTATSWISPEILEIPWETMEKWLNNNPELNPYRFGIEDLYRQQKHVLDEDKEKLLSYFSQFRGTPSDIYTSISTTDVKFPEVVLSGDDTVKATNGNYSRILATNRVQEDRKKIFEAHYGTYTDYKNTYASIYDAVCKRDWSSARARNYASSVESYLEGNNIPLEVYTNLVSMVKANTEPLKKYNRLRQKALGLEKYYSYDGSISLVDSDKNYKYDDATKLVLASVKPLGNDYTSKLETALAGGWLDVYENPGKRSGAYSAGVYGVHPYMLLNYNETIDAVFTLGHELGHTMHTLLSQENQPFSTASYTIFVAEVASTFNERLLLDYFLQKTDDPKERIALIQQAIRGITGTFYFQTLLADFELQVHSMVEEGKPITANVLDGLMSDLYDVYYGDSQEKDEFLKSVWARIPHIYRSPFYVYQYATCFVSSAKIYTDMMKATGSEKDKIVENYLNLLKSGGNNYPMEQLKLAGVDLTKHETMNAVIDEFGKLVDKLEIELNRLN
ncbi:MAG: oligoendopeptidase F [Ignavibacteriales bacterium]|nr:oligoendopeptidase F [Ignavibacteriales bacterium]